MAHDKAVPSETTLHQDERALRTEIVRVCRLMHERGLIAATDGNVSARLGEEHLLTTPTGVPKGLLREEDLVITDRRGRWCASAGPRRRTALGGSCGCTWRRTG